ncbi:neutral zinc metallopeptidase [Pseudoclavibacter alba]|uniref:Neutral zinc metallopeptidase n=1 Tax=Pseudoclavibacter albus TaxID=272241 RepID=A0ABT2HX65_9MICO|nr:neutral zinc metallopeptidase [Pseudoclavibacter alba]MCT2042908.1 neutral zinc metallopeptidase [Pseudoclavibacter alba]
MTFNENASIDTSGIQKRSGGAKGAAVGGGSLVALIIAFLISQFLGVDVTGLVTGQQAGGNETTEQLNCSGSDANNSSECRLAGAQNSINQYWSNEAPNVGIKYQTPTLVLYEGSTSSACGTASNQVGPFYCPGDEGVYIDADFFQMLESQFGAKDGPMAEMYILAHEWGHHIQQEAGILQQVDHRDVGATSDMVRLELQADCFAGAWAGAAEGTTDANGQKLFSSITQDDIDNAMNAAGAVGDDRIQESQGGRAQPDTFTHGTAEQRANWFATGLKGGWQSCDTFSVDATQL